MYILKTNSGMSSYKLANNWQILVDDVRAQRIRSTIPSVKWTNGNKHGLHEGGVSRDIISFISRRPNQTATRDEIITGLPTAFHMENKVPSDYSQEFLREIVKMGILESLNENV
jgi:hypothetical protein